MGPVEKIFDEKKKIIDFYPYSHSIKDFDMYHKHFLYGKIDREGDAIQLEETNLQPIRSGNKNANFAIDFVCDAFDDFRNHYRSRIAANELDKNSIYGNDIVVKKGQRQGDLENRYFNYTNKLYDEFTNTYLKVDRRHENITNFKTFLQEFYKYFRTKANYFPITKTGYILSYHCSPFVSGLMVEIAPGRHDSGLFGQIKKFVTDPNYKSGWMRTTSAKFGFMVDKNAPWRLVFNIASGIKDTDELNNAGAKYLAARGLKYENVFKFYYTKTHLHDLNNLKDVLWRFYNSYYIVNSTYERTEYITPESGGDCLTKKVAIVRENREVPPRPYENPSSVLNLQEYDEYFIKLLLKIRLLETQHPDVDARYDMFVKEIIETKRTFGVNSALNYINNLTKGYHVSKFLRKGKYWYGQTAQEYEEKKSRALETDPDYELVGTKNILIGR